MKKLFIHVGTHKAGSTTIQQYFEKHAAKLEPKAAFFKDSYFLSKQIMEQSFKASDVPALRQQLKRLGEEMPHESFFFSGEGFMGKMSNFYSDAYRNALLLREATCDFDVRIVVVFRRQIDFIESAYQQEISAQGATLDFAGFMESFPWREFDWLKILDEGYAKAFGAGKIEVIPFETFSTKENPCARIVSMLGLDGKDFGPVPKYNTSLSPQGLALMKTFNEVVAPDQAKLRSAFRVFLREHFPKAGVRISSPEIQERVFRHFQEANAELVRRYGFSGDVLEKWLRP